MAQNLFDLIFSETGVAQQPTAQYQVTTCITPRASENRIIPEPSTNNANNNENKQTSWDLSAFEAPQHSNSQTSSNSTERQQAADDLSDFFGTPVSASTPQQKASPLTQHDPPLQQKHVNDDFFRDNYSENPNEDLHPIQAQNQTHETHNIKDIPPVVNKQNNDQSPSSTADQHVRAKDKRKEDDKTRHNKPSYMDNEFLTKFVEELDEHYSNNMKKILTMMRDNATHAKEIVVKLIQDKYQNLVESNQRLERRLIELEEQNKQLVAAVKNLQSQNKTLTSRLSKYEGN